MSRLLDEAIALARKLPEDKQDAAAEALFSHLTSEARRHRLTPEQAEEVRRIQQNLQTGAIEPLPDEAMNAFWKSCGV